MASINGISLDGIKNFKGHEGETLFKGMLCLNGKEIGSWSQDSWGGPDHVVLNKPYDARLLDQAIVALNPDKAFHGGELSDPFTIDYTLTMLMPDYLELADDEKTFKKALKEGYAAIVLATDGYHQTQWSLPLQYAKMSDEALLKELDSDIQKAKASFWPERDYQPHKVKIFRSLDDFIIGEPIQEASITLKKDLDQILGDTRNQAKRADPPKKKENNLDR